MTRPQQHLVLTRDQALCLHALRKQPLLKRELVQATKLSQFICTRELTRFSEIGLAKVDRSNRWYVTTRGRSCKFETTPNPGPGRRRNVSPLTPSAIRLLEVLDRPMRRRTIANKMGVSHQRVHQLIVQLHASGHVCYADPTRPWWMVMTAQDTTPFLSHDTERVLSVLPQGYGTDVKKISVALQMPTQDVEASIHTLLDQALAREDCVAEGPAIYSLTPAGETHPQRVPHRAPAKAAHLTVGSERVRTVLAIIQESGALRIRDATERLGMPHQSLNALFQYLKRKRLIAKTDDGFFAPYSLTNNGHTTLTEMNRRNS